MTFFTKPINNLTFLSKNHLSTYLKQQTIFLLQMFGDLCSRLRIIYLQQQRIMKGKKLVNNQHLHTHLTHKPTLPTTRPSQKRKLLEMRSNDMRPRTQMTTHQPQPHKQVNYQQQQAINDYDWQRKQRQTLNYVPISQTINQFGTSNAPPQFRSQRNSNQRQFLQKDNHLMSRNSSNNVSRDNSQQRIKIFSVENKDKSLSRSQNSSVKKRGIEVTKTLLKRISGMYADKDFQNKSSYLKSSQNSTGLMASGKVQQEYQLSNLDFQIHNNHTVNISISNQLSFNDSGTIPRINDSLLDDRSSEGRQWTKQRDSGYWNKSHDSGFSSKNSKKILTADESKIKDSYVKCKARVMFAPECQKKQLPRVKSYDLMNTNRPLSQSIDYDLELDPPSKLTHHQSTPFESSSQNQKYVIRSKNRTLDEMSVKQSMVIGFDNYYQ